MTHLPVNKTIQVQARYTIWLWYNVYVLDNNIQFVTNKHKIRICDADVSDALNLIYDCEL